MKKLACVILFFLLSFPVGISFAQDPNTAQDNACFPNGSMAGKCDSAWAWVCGYYLARWESAGGWFAPNNTIPDWCASLLPPRPSSDPITGTSAALPPFPSAGCIFDGTQYLNFGGGYALGGGPFYTNPTCTPPDTAAAYHSMIVYAPAPYDPVALCQSVGTLGVHNAAANDIYYCSRP